MSSPWDEPRKALRVCRSATRTHSVSAFRSFQPELPVTARPSRSRQKQNIEQDNLHRFTSDVGMAPLTDHHGWNGEVFLCPGGVNILSFGFLYTSQSTFSFLISAVCKQNCIFFKKEGKMQSLGAVLLIVSMLLNISCGI